MLGKQAFHKARNDNDLWNKMLVSLPAQGSFLREFGAAEGRGLSRLARGALVSLAGGGGAGSRVGAGRLCPRERRAPTRPPELTVTLNEPAYPVRLPRRDGMEKRWRRNRRSRSHSLPEPIGGQLPARGVA